MKELIVAITRCGIFIETYEGLCGFDHRNIKALHGQVDASVLLYSISELYKFLSVEQPGNYGISLKRMWHRGSTYNSLKVQVSGIDFNNWIILCICGYQDHRKGRRGTHGLRYCS